MKKTTGILMLILTLGLSQMYASNTTEVILNQPLHNNVMNTSPLCLAIVQGDTEAVEMLISQGEDVNEKSNGMMPIHYAAKYNRVEIIKALITAGAEVHATCDKGFTPLKYAKMSNATESEQFLKRFKR